MQSLFYLLSFCFVLFVSCSNQITEKSTTPSSLVINDEATTSQDSIDTNPRVDSVLQFSVMITDIFQDSKGNYWFGTHGDGLCRYNGKQFTYFTANRGLPSGFVREIAPGPDWDKVRAINGGNQINEIQEDREGNIWLKTSDHICKFNGKEFVAIEVETKSTLSINKSDEEWKEELNYLWFGDWSELGLYRYDGDKLEYLTFPEEYSGSRDGVSEVYKDREGNIWFGTMEHGTFRYNGKSFTPINEKDKIGVCRSIFQDDTGRIWITNNRYGLYYWEDGKLTNFTKEYSLKNEDDLIIEEFSTGFQSIKQDENGDLWFGTFGDGLWHYGLGKLTHYTNDGELPIITAKTIYKDKKGKLWFGLGEGTVYGFNGVSFYRFDDKAPMK